MELQGLEKQEFSDSMPNSRREIVVVEMESEEEGKKERALSGGGSERVDGPTLWDW
jgi:hypothetical protein